MSSRRRSLVLVLFAGSVVTLVITLLLHGRETKESGFRLRVVNEIETNGEQIVIFRAGVADYREVLLDLIYLSRGPASDTNQTGYPAARKYLSEWRHPNFRSAGSSGMTFVGEKEFAIVAPADWPIWRLRATAAFESRNGLRNAMEKLEQLWGILKEHRFLRSSAIKQILGARFFGNFQVLESDIITNAVSGGSEPTAGGSMRQAQSM